MYQSHFASKQHLLANNVMSAFREILLAKPAKILLL
jgi:hypothetical protein